MSRSTVCTDSNAMDRYKRLEKLGEGTYGLVYKAIDKKTNKFVAIKKIKLDNNEEGIPATTMREISLLSHLKHSNIIEMDGCLYIDGELYLVFEYMSCDLKGYIDYLGHHEYINPNKLKKFTYYLTEGIRFCHTHRILHRDLKPQNILISNDGALKIADFGLGREHGLPITELTHEVVTLWYRPPEILLGKKTYSGACDVWGIGCILAEMATKVPLFPGDSEIDQLFQIYKIMGTPNEEVWPGISKLAEYKPMGPKWKKKNLYNELHHKLDLNGIHLLQQMLTYAPHLRITAKKALSHSWFDDIRDEMIEEFGNIYPHCGDKQFQLKKYQKENQENLLKQEKQRKHRKKKDISIDTDDDEDEDEDEEEQDDEDEDDAVTMTQEIESENENDVDDFDEDDDITQNAEEWMMQNNNNNNRNKKNSNRGMEIEDRAH